MSKRTVETERVYEPKKWKLIFTKERTAEYICPVCGNFEEFNIIATPKMCRNCKTVLDGFE